MTQNQQDRIKHLLKLADVCQEMEFVELKLTDAWCSLREEFGLAKLLLMIESYVKNKSEVGAQTPPT